MDYSKLIDSETWDFIRHTGDFYPPDTVEMSVADQRRVYDEMCRAFFRGYPEGVSARDSSMGGVRVRVYQKGAPAFNVAYLHGGGFLVGGLESHDDVCAEICDRTGARVISVDYRLAPEHKHPAAFDDTVAVVRDVATHWPGRLVLAGDSAGANLAAAAAHALRGEVALAGQVLIYGGFGGDIEKGSYVRHANAPLLTRAEILFYGAMRYENGEPENDPTAAPLDDTDFTGLPPTVLISAQCDPLADDSREYAAALKAAGGQVVHVEEAGLVHGYLRARVSVKRARDSFDRIITAIDALGRDKPFPPAL